MCSDPRDPGGEVRGLSLIHISEPTRLGMISYAVFCCWCFLQPKAAVCGVRHNFLHAMERKRNIFMILCQSENEENPPHPKDTHLSDFRMHFLFTEIAYMGLQLDAHQR